MFIGLKEGVTYVKMNKLEKKKSLVSSWEGPFCSQTIGVLMGSWNKMKAKNVRC
jgi:hypothetical protein